MADCRRFPPGGAFSFIGRPEVKNFNYKYHLIRQYTPCPGKKRGYSILRITWTNLDTVS